MNRKSKHSFVVVALGVFFLAGSPATADWSWSTSGQVVANAYTSWENSEVTNLSNWTGASAHATPDGGGISSADAHATIAIDYTSSAFFKVDFSTSGGAGSAFNTAVAEASARQFFTLSTDQSVMLNFVLSGSSSGPSQQGQGTAGWYAKVDGNVYSTSGPGGHLISLASGTHVVELLAAIDIYGGSFPNWASAGLHAELGVTAVPAPGALVVASALAVCGARRRRR